MKRLVKRMLRPYHLELGRVEAYESNGPATTQSDTTTTHTFDGTITYYPPQDSINVEGTTTEIKTVDGDTVSTQTDTVNVGVTKEDAEEANRWFGGRAWDAAMEWIFGEDDT